MDSLDEKVKKVASRTDGFMGSAGLQRCDDGQDEPRIESELIMRGNRVWRKPLLTFY